MREIKFRAWNTLENKMLQSDDLTAQNWNVLLSITENEGSGWRFMQYTGLKDKNGKEIYEGDIVRILYSDWGSQSDYSITLEQHKINESQIGTVVFEYCEYLLQFDEYTDTLHHGAHGERHIIGNIYENPELLTPNTQ